MRFLFLLLTVLFFSSCSSTELSSSSFVPDAASKSLNSPNPLRREALIPSTTASIGCVWKDFWTKEPGAGLLYMDCTHKPVSFFEEKNDINVKTHSGATLFMSFIPYQGGTPIEEMSLFVRSQGIDEEECMVTRRADAFGTARGVVRLIIEPKEHKLLPPGEVPCKGWSAWEGQEIYFEFQDGKPHYVLIRKEVTSNWFDEDSLVVE